MADQPVIEDESVERRASRWPRPLRWLGYGSLGIFLLLLALIAFLHTPPGRQLIVDQIAKVSPASGLSVEVESIEGSVLWSATFNDVKLRDANDTLFLEVPRVDLNWRPWKWFFTGLDVRHLVLSDGTLYAAPELIPGDPDAPLLPDFDIRVDRLVIEDLTVAEGLLGEERVIQFRTEADIRSGRVFLDADGEFGGGDVFGFLVEAEPDGDVFDLDLDWRAPVGGFLATMVGAEEELVVSIKGDGSWTSWKGDLLAVQGGDDLLDFDIYNETGQYRLVGQAFPGDYVSGLPARALGSEVAFTASGTLEDSTLDGSFALRGKGIDLDGSGGIDLADNRFEDMTLEAALLDPELLDGVVLDDATMRADLNGAFSELEVPHELRIGTITAGTIVFADIVQEGTISFEGERMILPLDMQVGRVTSGIDLFDPRLVGGNISGTLAYAGSTLNSDDLSISFPGMDARLGMRGNFDNGSFRFSGPVTADDLAFFDMGLVDAASRIDFAIGGGVPWTLDATVQGRMPRVDNSTIETIAGENIRFAGALAVSETRPLTFSDMRIEGSKLDALVDGRLEGGETLMTVSGTHADYGTFAGEARLAGDGPYADLVFDSPLPAADLSNVRVALAPSEDGFAIETSGNSLLGPFDGLIDLVLPEAGEAQIGVRRLDVAETRVSGNLRLVEGGVAGRLALTRGGVDGVIGLAARPGGQAFDVELTARNARFGTADRPLTLARADMDMRGFIGGEATTLEGEMTAQGISWGNFFLGRMAVDAQLTNGVGTFDAALAGRRGSRFELLLNGQATGERIALAADGSYAGVDITMPRRAVLLRTDDGGWQLQRTQLGYGDGYAVVEGRFGGEAPPEGRLNLLDMPVALADVVAGDLGLGGTLSGVVELAADEDGMPIGEARVVVNDFTRSGLLLTSRPIDLALVADLSADLLQARAVMENGSGIDGRVNARISNLPREGGLMARLYGGDLLAQLRYDGPAEALWRLAAIDLLDVTGPLEVAANARGTLANPQVRGSLQGDNLHLQSALTGTDISGVSARGRFDGSRLQLTSFSGEAPNGGRVSGSGFVDLSNMTRERGPQIDIRLAASNARILQLPGMGATVTGPMRIVSSGVGGTIAGRLTVREAEWRLASADEAVELPDIAITEINTPVDIAPPGRAGQPWHYLIDARATRGIKVDGMGLDSEWSGDIRLRGTTADPRIGGEVRIVPRQGFYSFAGTRFEITRGRIDFDEAAPPDPRLDLLAESGVNGIDVDVTVRGSASQPEIAFSSVPALPEEELLARMLFGGSVTDLSATDALQLGAALASLRGGGGVDPINRLRSAIGLDRLRIMPADPALNRGTSVALGKNITRRLYAELVTDGQGYNATELEFRVTGWLSLLGSISTLGRGEAAVEISRDY
ncbi:translocation/assembly module TamB domain-containing protein [Alteraurantiacibacter aquimixticola]|uniref:DUF490 domain-containing protein n=1 Tax=Alteraurantiacibacter aquimixticola TaxID=2489173 RepID=A0A4T3F2D0_9SPHN|nr:translocation/assembly module TamB domain-containing protein [Alteraurantiacibacter aquimixticola]TIX51346.1 DUF490 domain-containing protein [Alteraurantiacibacter aquimixticola]